MFDLSTIFAFVKAKAIFIKGAMLTFTTPYIGLILSSILFYIAIAVTAAAFLYAAIIAANYIITIINSTTCDKAEIENTTKPNKAADNIKVKKEDTPKAPGEFQFARDKVQKSIILHAPDMLQFVSDTAQKSIILHAPDMLQFASDKVQKEIILQDPNKIQFASDAILEDKETVLEACRKARGLTCDDNILDNERVIRAAIKHGDMTTLIFTNDKILNNKDIALLAIEKKLNILPFINQELQEDIILNHQDKLKRAGINNEFKKRKIGTPSKEEDAHRKKINTHSYN